MSTRQDWVAQAVVDAVVSLIDAKAFVSTAGGIGAVSEDETARAFDFVAAHLGEGRATAKPQVIAPRNMSLRPRCLNPA